MNGILLPVTVSTKQQKIATMARQEPDKGFHSLSHHIDVDWLREAYRRTRKDGAPGIDQVTAEAYADNLEANLRDLLDRAKSGDRYRAPAVRRVHIPKGDGTKTRPIGIPTFEDKVLQRAVAMVLEPIYEQDFLDCSYGFRPGRSAHQALQATWRQLMNMGGGIVIEVDIQGFFDACDRTRIQEILKRRVRDGVVLRLIGKWLHAGVWEEGRITYPETGTPQGGVISPILSNVYLHEVMDTWFERDVRPHLRGQAFLIRYADDIALGFTREDDAKRVMDVLPKRFEKYGLTLHPEKTRMIDFRKPGSARGPRGPGGPTGPGTFDLLGFTHFWVRTLT
jgi:group II intron reverse transcriptase/maturase